MWGVSRPLRMSRTSPPSSAMLWLLLVAPPLVQVSHTQPLPVGDMHRGPLFAVLFARFTSKAMQCSAIKERGGGASLDTRAHLACVLATSIAVLSRSQVFRRASRPCFSLLMSLVLSEGNPGAKIGADRHCHWSCCCAGEDLLASRHCSVSSECGKGSAWSITGTPVVWLRACYSVATHFFC